mgnify:CR=1 FL=1
MILVTGGTGLVGCHLLYSLVKENKKVRALYRKNSKTESVRKVFSYYSKDYKKLLKPIIVKRWVSEIKYIEYIFDNNVDNKYDNDVIIIPEYIFQDDNKKDALNKIAYHIYNYEVFI